MPALQQKVQTSSHFRVLLWFGFPTSRFRQSPPGGRGGGRAQPRASAGRFLFGAFADFSEEQRTLRRAGPSALKTSLAVACCADNLVLSPAPHASSARV